MLEATKIFLHRGGRPILRDIQLRIEPGKVSVVLGPNGAGKTSLLRVLSGEWDPDPGGEVRFHGQPLPSLPVRRLGQLRAYLHQESSLDFAFTALEVVLLGRSPHMRGGERPEDYSIARDTLARVDLADRADDLYTHLSGGEKQRVQLARVLAQIEGPPEERRQRCLFLDEPTNNLDLWHQETVQRVVREVADGGTSVVMIIHDINQAIRNADHVFVLSGGRLALEGAPEAVAADPRFAEIFRVRLKSVRLEGHKRPFLLVE